MNTNTNAIGMSFKKKALIALCALVAVVAIVVSSVMATVAYLTASASITNEFSVGNIKISLDETVVNNMGVPIEDAEGKTTRADHGNSYLLVPGTKYTKDPIVHVLDGSMEGYLFVTVRNDIAPLASNDDSVANPSIAQQLLSNGWVKFATVHAGTVYVYVGATKAAEYVRDNKVVDGAFVTAPTKDDVTFCEPGNYPVFEEFTIDKDLTNEAIEKYNAAKLIVNAFAIQDEGFGTVQQAWDIIVNNYGSIVDLTPVVPTGEQG